MFVYVNADKKNTLEIHFIQGVPGGMCQTSGEGSLSEKTPI